MCVHNCVTLARNTRSNCQSVGGIFLELTIDHHDHMTISTSVKNPSELRSVNFIQYVQVITVKKDINEKKCLKC